MSIEETLQSIVVHITPASLRALILELAELRPAHDQSGVPLPAIIEALTTGQDLGSGAQQWSAHLRLRKIIIETAALLPSMLFVEGDA